jgi:hypothetical protein
MAFCFGGEGWQNAAPSLSLPENLSEVEFRGISAGTNHCCEKSEDLRGGEKIPSRLFKTKKSLTLPSSEHKVRWMSG